MSQTIADDADDLLSVALIATGLSAAPAQEGDGEDSPAPAGGDLGLAVPSAAAAPAAAPVPAPAPAEAVLVAPAAADDVTTTASAPVTGSSVPATSPPAAPVILADEIFAINRARLTGTAAPDATITIYLGDVAVGSGVADATGAWTATTAPLPAGANFLTATATDASGAVSPQSAPFDPVAGTPNPIAAENAKTGTPMDVWWVAQGEDSVQLQGFTTQMGTDLGGTVQFKINNLTGNAQYSIEIYRLGYYGGDGARLITTLNHNGAVVQPAPLTDPKTGLVDAGNWSVTDSWSLPADAVSGVYVANVRQGAKVFQIPFVVSNPSSHSDVLFQTADETWQAYNSWGGSNVYGGSGPGVAGSAYAVSYNRPIISRDGGDAATDGEFATANDMLFTAEYAAIYWMEQNGYDISYISGNQVATAPNDALLLNHKVYMDVGHDEYWSDQQYRNVLAAQNAGVNMMFWSGNEVYWQTRFAPSLNATADPNRTLITYKDTHANALIDPTGTATSAFMDARFATTGGLAGTPANALTGQVFSVDSPRDDQITLSYGETQLSIWNNTAIQQNTQPGQTATLSPGLLGYEWDSSPDNGFMPSSLISLSSTTLQVQTQLLDYGNTTGPGTATHHLVEFRNPVSGALVFGAGTVYWSFGLSDQHDVVGGALPPVDPNVQQAMVNEFAAMGVQPQTLQASLVLAQAAVAHPAPTSTITSLSTLTPVEGHSVTVTGTAHSTGDVIGGVMVSVDGGATWHPASTGVGASSVNWSYTFNAGAPGTYTVQSQAIDSSVNVETPSQGVSFTVQRTANLTLFSPSATPDVLNASDAPVEVGMKFVTATPGEITGVRFYKGAQNTGAHIGDLWSSTGQLLASATFSNESASGWQQVNFSTPVVVQPGQTYVVSYHTNSGYSYTPYYFTQVGAGYSNGSLTAAGNGLNGVFAYSPSAAFPATTSFVSSNNYWVDVVFNDQPLPPQPHDDSGFTTNVNTALTIPAAQLLTNDLDPNGLAVTIAGVGGATNGVVSYDAQANTVTFTPTAGYIGPASFSYSVTDAEGGVASANVSLTVLSSSPTQTLFSAGSTPAVASADDHTPVELGVKFTANADGEIYGVRFYKGPNNTGVHIGDLWGPNGALLATATFSGESASGWQEVDFAKPVDIVAGATYVAAYHTNAGGYSATPGYFSSSLVSGALTAPAGANGVYAYGASDVLPTNSYNSTNYWVDVVYAPSSGPLPPVANNDSGFVTAPNAALTIAASQLLANDTDPRGLALSLTGVSNAVNGQVSFNAQTQTVTFTPAANYTGPASFSYAIADSAGNVASAQVSLTVTSASPTETLFSATATPATITVNDANAVELGVKFTASVNGYVNGVRFYKGPQNTGAHVGDLWSASGTLLATATFANESASGWQQVNFSSPVAVTAGATYVASYHTNVGEYSATGNYFTSNVVSGDLTAPAAGNGLYAYGGSSVFPTASYNATNYWVDPVYTPAGGAQPPVAHDDAVTATRNTPLILAASQLLANDSDPNGLPLSIASVANALDGAVSYDAGAQTVTFTPATGYSGLAGFDYTITDAGGGSATAHVAVTVADPSLATLFSPSAVPATVNANDTNPVELGVKFTASQAGEVVGVRFYKGSQNTGAHVADLWSASGTLLASTAFANETASGWQEADFAAPITIAAGTTYVAAYHTSVGHYAYDSNLFANPLTNGPLTAPASSASGGNGVYAYGATDLFPSNSYNATSYGVDVVFRAT